MSGEIDVAKHIACLSNTKYPVNEFFKVPGIIQSFTIARQ